MLAAGALTDFERSSVDTTIEPVDSVSLFVQVDELETESVKRDIAVVATGVDSVVNVGVAAVDSDVLIFVDASEIVD